MSTLARQIPLPFAARRRPYTAVLVELPNVCTELGVSRDTVREYVDCGYLRYVFDLAAPSARARELRFDLAEVRLLAAEQPRSQESIDEAVERIVGHRLSPELHSESVADLLCTTRTVIHQWLRHGELTGPTQVAHRQMVSRHSIVEFLKRRVAV